MLADKLHHQLLQWKAQLDSKMVILTATAAVAPLLGLLGTVSGMIHTFEMMNLFGNQDQTMLAGGISEALVTNELGLVVAVPVLLIHAYINRRRRGKTAGD
ncbi:MotA/TolQ/ExbB proton channel family protein [Endozoicomonas sp. SCSIO W0465]|uniref:MotA/TolQ/ExbB proton channel family protein n=1 Tax=Endozoicomonas sp. SCSIO W0465 TaxID=2918516 RepID=UPI003531F1FE